MKTLLLTLIIMGILSIGVKIGNEFKPMTYSPKVQFWSMILGIIFLIWEINIYLSL